MTAMDAGTAEQLHRQRLSLMFVIRQDEWSYDIRLSQFWFHFSLAISCEIWPFLVISQKFIVQKLPQGPRFN